MFRLIGLASLLLGIGMTAYFGAQEGKGRPQRQGTSVESVHALDGGDPLPTPRP